MNVAKISNTQPRFGSNNYPIEPFTINTAHGSLVVEELSRHDITKAGAFSFNSAIESLPYWRAYWTGRSEDTKNIKIKMLENHHIDTLKKNDGNSTILIGKDSGGNIKTLFSLQNFDEFGWLKEKFKDVKTGFVEECMVDSKYRDQGIGKIIFDKLLKTADNRFTDIYLEADNNAINFYKRAGFSPLDTSNPLIKKVSDYILANREDREFLTLMSKSLDPTNPWWERIVKHLK